MNVTEEEEKTWLDKVRIQKGARRSIEIIVLLFFLIYLSVIKQYVYSCVYVEGQNSPDQGCMTPQAQKAATFILWCAVSILFIITESFAFWFGKLVLLKQKLDEQIKKFSEGVYAKEQNPSESGEQARRQLDGSTVHSERERRRVEELSHKRLLLSERRVHRSQEIFRGKQYGGNPQRNRMRGLR